MTPPWKTRSFHAASPGKYLRERGLRLAKTCFGPFAAPRLAFQPLLSSKRGQDVCFWKATCCAASQVLTSAGPNSCLSELSQCERVLDPADCSEGLSAGLCQSLLTLSCRTCAVIFGRESLASYREHSCRSNQSWVLQTYRSRKLNAHVHKYL